LELTRECVGTNLNLGSKEEPKMVKLNIDLDDVVTSEAEALLREYKDEFAWF
jgi:hypothetical protein